MSDVTCKPEWESPKLSKFGPNEHSGKGQDNNDNPVYLLFNASQPTAADGVSP